ncbi:hypothetical protein [Nakamurella leprariae]|uniref:Uncharacterized protein n=1 Tax=Nakamurella leprariae TaxID=2803911 RepID=A0A938YDF2_9ACTN|nr:hypothetical protein [Nakamurella leprariae]MBM9467541.1 hypothetical protein [Nakamurella leprariae]
MTTVLTGLSVDAGSAAAEPATATDRAWTWVRSMLDSPTPVASASTITPDRDYPVDWTGPVTGRIVVRGLTQPAVTPGTVALDPASASAAADPDHRGVVSGSVALPAQAGRWIIQVYRADGGVRTQAPRQALVGPDGRFTVDLAGLTPGPGRWEFGVLDAAAAYAPTGEPWPAGDRVAGWEVRAFATTDTTYPVGTGSVQPDGTFTVPATAIGMKSFQLVDVSTGTPVVLAEHAPDTGLVRSYAGPGQSPLTHTYDQALALHAALLVGDEVTAARLTRGLAALQVQSGAQAGAFVSAAPQWNPAGGQQHVRTGNTAVAVAALLAYVRDADATDPVRVTAVTAAEAGLSWLAAHRITAGTAAGLIAGGAGDVVGGTFSPDVPLGWVSTEHNLDAWQAFRAAAAVLDCTDCAATADGLAAGLRTQLWHVTEHRFRQGLTADGTPDDVDALDVNAWGALFLQGTSATSGSAGPTAAAALAATAPFAVTDGAASGYLPFRAQPSMPSPVAAVWVEGTCSVALAQSRTGDAAAASSTLAGVAGLQRADGSFPAATAEDPFTGYSPASSVAATSWFLLASAAGDPRSIWA